MRIKLSVRAEVRASLEGVFRALLTLGSRPDEVEVGSDKPVEAPGRRFVQVGSLLSVVLSTASGCSVGCLHPLA